MKNLEKDSLAYYGNNDYYELFSESEDSLNLVSQHIKKYSKDKIVLDAGCGSGKYLPIIESVSKKYIGIDLSNEQLKIAKNKIKKDSSILISSNLNNIKLEDNSVDLIISCWVLGTITNIEERNKCLSELKRVLKPNGIIILVENDENSEFEEIRNRHLDSRTRDYNNWITNNGFVIDKKINTEFRFENYETAKKCINVIYGEEVSNKLKNNKIEHKIIVFKYNK